MDINKIHLKYYKEALERAESIKELKTKDYNSAGVTRFDYVLHGNQTFLDEIYKKVLRLRSLIDSGQTPNNESIEDTLLDIINYSADFYSYLCYQNDSKKIGKKE